MILGFKGGMETQIMWNQCGGPEMLTMFLMIFILFVVIL